MREKSKEQTGQKVTEKLQIYFYYIALTATMMYLVNEQRKIMALKP